MLRSPIFVVGHPRSGTTLLASMLGRHPLIASTPESLFLSQARYDIRLASDHTAQQIASRAMRTPFTHLVADEQGLAMDLEKAFAEGAPRSERTLFACGLENFRSLHGKDRVLEKSPLHLRHIPELLDWFPDARILWIIRDGRGCVASLQKVPWATHDAAFLAKQWVRNMAFGFDAERSAGKALMTLRYEDLVTSPSDMMTRVCAHIGVPFAEEILDSKQSVTTIKPSEMGWKENVTRPLQGDRVKAWLHELTPSDRAIATSIMLPFLVQLGYEASEAGASSRISRMRAAILSQRISVDMMRSAFHLSRRLAGAKQSKRILPR